MTRPPIKDRALRLLRDAQAAGYASPALCRDYARVALEDQGVDPDTARKQVQRVWDENFEVWWAV